MEGALTPLNMLMKAALNKGREGGGGILTECEYKKREKTARESLGEWGDFLTRGKGNK